MYCTTNVLCSYISPGLKPILMCTRIRDYGSSRGFRRIWNVLSAECRFLWPVRVVVGAQGTRPAAHTENAGRLRLSGSAARRWPARASERAHPRRTHCWTHRTDLTADLFKPIVCRYVDPIPSQMSQAYEYVVVQQTEMGNWLNVSYASSHSTSNAEGACEAVVRMFGRAPPDGWRHRSV